MVFTTSSLFLQTLAQVGITHVFVNWGSDHSAILEELERQRVVNGDTVLKVILSPNEMVALSAAHGYAQATGRPAAVIVHVGVGTQALAGAVHNADNGKIPILIYAGASPFTIEGELKGSRNEWIHWMQDFHDHPAVVRPYMRYTAQISSPAGLPNLVRRALQIATSDPKGPVYLWGRREVMEQEIDQSLMEAQISLAKWPSIESTALPLSVVQRIASALLTAKSPLLITSHVGRNHTAIPVLDSLSRILALPVFVTCPSTVNLPISHPFFVGISYLTAGTQTTLLKSADVVLVIDAEVAWIPVNKDATGAHERPSNTAQVFVIDSVDPLKISISMHHDDADLVSRADAAIALSQIRDAVGDQTAFKRSERAERTRTMHETWLAQLHDAERFPTLPSPSVEKEVAYTVPQIVAALRTAMRASGISREGTLILNESVSNFPAVWSHMQPEVPGEIVSSGGSSLGWAIGAGIGAVLGGRVAQKGKQHSGYELVASIVGDGTFLFCAPSSAFWMAMRYRTPFLTVVLNNGGWKSPKLSMLAVHPLGYGSSAAGDDLTVGFGSVDPDYVQIAVAASSGWAWGKKVDAKDAKDGKVQELLQETMMEAVKVVIEERRCAVVECVLERV